MNLFLPEIVIAAAAFLTLALEVFCAQGARRSSRVVAVFGVFVALACLIWLGPSMPATLGGRFAVDAVGYWFKALFLVSAAVAVSLSDEVAEYQALTLFALLGMMCLASSRDLVSVMVSLELATLPLVLMAAFRKTSISGEGAIKYLLTAAVASALLLYGLGFVYAFAGSFDFGEIRQALTNSRGAAGLYFAMALIVAGVGFKLSLVPFHMWAPDVYESAPTSLVAFISVASKATGLLLGVHLLYRLFGQSIGDWSSIFAGLAAVTMTLGNLVAIRQTQMKRLMAYSAISQAGYLILGFLGLGGEGGAAMIYYMLVYALTNLAAFSVINWLSEKTGRDDIAAYGGLSQTHPLPALALMISFFGLAGIPPLAGFVGKFFLFGIAAQSGYNWLVAVAAVNSTVSLYYYLQVIRVMYINPPPQNGQIEIEGPQALVMGVLAIGSVVFGVIPIFYNSVATTTAAIFTSYLGK